MKFAATAMLALLVGGAAVAQTPSSACPTEKSGTRASSMAFVDAYQAAKAALLDKRYEDAIARTDEAQLNAKHKIEMQAVTEIRLAAYRGLKDEVREAAALEYLLADPCLSPARRENLLKSRAGLPSQ